MKSGLGQGTVVVALVLLAACGAVASSDSPAAVEAMLTALGGREAIGQLRSLSVEAACSGPGGEFRTWVESFLPAFTSNPATVLGLEGKGRIAAGADADLAVLDERGRPVHVMARGVWHVRDRVPLRTGTFEGTQEE